MSEPTRPFWQAKPLAAMSEAEWESLCDGCGRCCLVKLEDEDTGRIHFTDVGCRLLDGESCRCRDYRNRSSEVPDCVTLRPDNIAGLHWMPPTCAYRLLAEGKGLPDWHPLVSGRPDSVVEAGVSVKGRLSGHEEDFSVPELVERIRAWPGRWPKGARPARKAKADGNPRS
ncbi:MAG: YcgN family cysteine cluster protein [Methylobacterium sp.]|nr:YcgN family cysteine cluster protein [Methylobacterium sp.]MCA3603298.1 YcgN family cysteine cluster protein [Methylobacterium sp.]MCA3614202.1 YcgN family cysteine cluster protein [Methylobacterium sp.]